MEEDVQVDKLCMEADYLVSDWSFIFYTSD